VPLDAFLLEEDAFADFGEEFLVEGWVFDSGNVDDGAAGADDSLLKRYTYAGFVAVDRDVGGAFEDGGFGQSRFFFFGPPDFFSRVLDVGPFFGGDHAELGVCGFDDEVEVLQHVDHRLHDERLVCDGVGAGLEVADFGLRSNARTRGGAVLGGAGCTQAKREKDGRGAHVRRCSRCRCRCRRCRWRRTG
jgi:hypothetical protein